MPFFAIVSRHFVSSLFADLSRPALHVYTYLRTWCTSPAGQASQWVELRVAKIADAIGRTTRHVRRGLAELRHAGLVETAAVFLDGAQRANRIRILPEPGYLSDTTTTPRMPRTDEDGEIDPAVVEAAAEVVEAVPGWAADALEAAEAAEADALELVSALADGTADPEVWGQPGTPRRADCDRVAARAAEEARADVAAAREAIGSVAAALQVPAVWRLAVSTTVARSARALQARGESRRVVRELASQAACEAAIRRVLATE